MLEREKRRERTMRKSIKLVVLSVVFLVISTVSVQASQTVNQSYPLSSGVTYSQYTYKGSNTNRINHLAMNLNDATTNVTVGIPEPFASRVRTTVLANRQTAEGHRVVGAINAAFFDMSEGYPLFLIAQNNRIVNGGTVSKGSDEYMNVPTAFGVKDGQGIIDYFDFDIVLRANGERYEMSGMNRERQAGETVIFTAGHYKSSTGSNQYGYEVLVETAGSTKEVSFGETLTGKIKQVTAYGQSIASIPNNSFVISIQGGSPFNKPGQLQGLAIGTDVSVTFSVDDKWNNADYIVASGPMLVRDGAPYIMMSTSSSRAKEVTARTIVGISKDKKTVHFVTIDGKQSSSPGMNLSQVANYLVSLGVDTAINLDGGGSTTMGIRKHGTNVVTLANTPSAGSERAVNAILQAVSTAPLGQAKHIKFTRTNVGTMLVGTTSTINVDYVMDANYNTLDHQGKLAFNSKNKTLQVNGYSFTATQPGTDELNLYHDGALFQSFPVQVVDGPTSMTINGSNSVTEGASTNYVVGNVKDSAGKDIVYNASQVKWAVEGDIGTISSTGQFTASKAGEGKIVATLGTKTFKAIIRVAAKEKDLFKDVGAKYPYAKELEFLTNNKYITGYTDGTFRPTQTLSRAHGAVIIARVLGLDTTNIENPNFNDVPKTHTYYKEIAAAANAGIIGGFEGNFNPSGNLTRAQMAKMIVNAFELVGESDKIFTDVDPAHWSVPFIQTLVFNNVTTGYTDGTFKPNESITRMHYGLFLYRVLNP